MSDQMASNNSKSVRPHFEVGEKVRVKPGVAAPDYEDIPLGGWAGTITGIEQDEGQVVYEIEWDEKTLKSMHPVYRKRCERDDLELESMWLDDEDLEADDGTPVPIEQPTEIKTPPLSKKDQDDRVRMALGLTHDDPLPEISHETLRAYHRYLSEHLRFPFTAFYGEEAIGPYSRKQATMTVTGLLAPEDGGLDVDEGLIGVGRLGDEEIELPLREIEVRKKDPNARLVSDYAYWFDNWPPEFGSGTVPQAIEPQAIEPDVGFDRPPKPWGFLKTVVYCGLAGGLLGATIGAALETIRGAGLATMIGGIPLALIGALLLGRYGAFFGAVNRLRYRGLLGIVLGLVGGGLLGVLAGLMVVALPWSLLGLFAGVIVGPYLATKRWKPLGRSLGVVLGICGSIVFVAGRNDLDQATAKVISGSIIGTIAGSGLFIALIGALSLFSARPMGFDRTGDKPGDSEEDDEDGILPMRPTSRKGR